MISMSITFVLVLINLCLLVMPFIIAVVVYKDAKKRGMDGVLWALAAFFIPGFIGVIIYLVVRSRHPSTACARCGAFVEDMYMICPYCGAELKTRCETCGVPVEWDWKLCAHCGSGLPEGRRATTVDHSQKDDKKLWISLICLVLIPLILIFSIVLIGIVTYSFVGTEQVVVEEIVQMY